MALIDLNEEGTEPSTPPAGYLRIFHDGVLKSKDENGVVTAYTAGITEEAVEDIVGGLFADSSTLDVTYDDAGNAVTIDVIDPLVIDDITLSSMTVGSVLFAGTSGAVTEDNANFFWDNTNNRLGIGTASPAGILYSYGTPASGVPVLGAKSAVDTIQATVEIYSHTNNPIFTLKQHPSTAASGLITNVSSIVGLAMIDISSGAALGSSSAIQINSSNVRIGYDSGATTAYFSTSLSAAISFRVNATERLKINTDGSVVVNGFTASAIGLTVKGAASQTANLAEWQNSAATVKAKVNAAGDFSNTGGQTSSEIFGAGATASGAEGTAVGALAVAAVNATAIGSGATAAGNAIAIGRGANAGSSNVVIGLNSTGAGSSLVVIGPSASGAGNDVVIGQSASVVLGNSVAVGTGAVANRSSIAVGYQASCGGFNDGIVVLGRAATATAANQFIAGSSSYPCTNVFFGKGPTDATPTAYTINGVGGSGTDIAGADLQIAGGKGTGAGTPGNVVIQTSTAAGSSSTLQTLATRVTVSPSGVNIVGTLQCDSITNDTGLAAGTYTPTRSAEANLDSTVTMSEAQYMRVGNTVTVSGRFTADPTLPATATSFEFTLPVSSNIGAVEDVAGVAFCGGIAGMGAELSGSVANDTAVVSWISSDTTSQSWSYTMTYQVI